MRDSTPPDRTADPDGSDGHDWVDDYLLDGADDDVCLELDEPITRGTLREMVAARAAELTEAGLHAGGAVSLCLPPSLAYVVNLLAAWRVGAQVSLLDHRLTAHEVSQALARLRPQVVVSPSASTAGPSRRDPGGGVATERYDGVPAATPHALLQLSSGSTGPSKVIGRTAADLRAEVARYRAIDGTPRPGERVVLLASMVHVLGLVGGLLDGLHTGVRLVVPRSLSRDAILSAVAAAPEPTTVIGVPFHIEFLTGTGAVPHLPQLRRMTVGGELVRPAVREAFQDRYQVPLGVMYGMTEAGVIATDLSGAHWPALTPAPGMSLREEDGQLLLATATSPYVGATDPGRWVDGWLYTRDAGTVDPDTGLVTVRGRLDSQVSVGGLKVDLTEVEQTLAELPGVAEVVVAHDGAIEAFVALTDDTTVVEVKEAMAQRLASYKRPRRLTVVDALPRTATGKLVRSLPVLRSAAGRTDDNDRQEERSGANVR